MIQRFSTNFAVFSYFFDLGVAFGTIYLSRLLRPFLSHLPIFKPLNELPDIPPAIYILFPLIWTFFLFFFSVYDGKKNLKVIDEYSYLTMASLLAAITMAGLLYFTYRDISRGFFIVYLIFTFLLLLLWRTAARVLYKQRIEMKGYKPKILIIGAGPVGFGMKGKLEAAGKDTYKFIGFLDDSPEKQKTLKEVLGSTLTAREIVEQKHIDHVIIALPRSAHEKVDQLIKDFYSLPVRISVIPDYFHISIHHARLIEFAGFPLLDLRAPALTENQRLTKRIFDVIITLSGLIPALPLMLIISLLILMIDGKPVIFVQKRVGENGRLISIYKFRTMVVDADKLFDRVSKKEDNGTVIYKSRADPRITSLGRFLRRFSLDELPQLFNILRGTLSLVGPRPELPILVEQYQPWQRARLAVPQGLTGWWQIQGRSDHPLHLHIEDDLFYIEHYSMWLDISIIIKTIWIVLRGKGAY
jgi:exopolysaccharide biosynthesis polyprenyl glycosylphosphotransferase